MVRWWRDLAVSKKLYAVVGVMALLIASELFTLLFAMEVLSAVRSFVGGEGLWSKAQKNAVHSLHRYAFTRDPKYYAEFRDHLKVPMGDRAARIELEKPEYDMQAVLAGFTQGGIHRDDVPGLVKLIRRFYWVKPIEEALVIWREADTEISALIEAGEELHVVISHPRSTANEIDQGLQKIDVMNERLTKLEVEFSDILGAGSRWLEGLLMMILILAVLTVECTGLGLTIAFSRNLNRSLSELTANAAEVGRGNLNARVPVRSGDELGQLARSLNQMAVDLGRSLQGRQKAESANEVKSQFLANMSHEIRTPLGVILGLAEILKDPDLNWADHQRYVETVERTGRNLMRIINDILDLSKVEAGHLEIVKTRFPLSDLMNELQTMLSVRAKETQNRLLFNPVGDMPAAIVTDRARLRQIVVNLVNNALKFTHKGDVTITYEVREGLLAIEVSGSGTGISKQDQERIFQAFTRSGQSDDQMREGTGLGLMLSRRFAQALGGDVKLVRSAPGEGSIFLATVGCEAAAQPSTAPHLAAASRVGRRGFARQSAVGEASARAAGNGSRVRGERPRRSRSRDGERS
ncbi:MAG TPA: ATP-binding protein [Bdellovibrionales bacterium]|nr:ATP-binding protein [Bdellovibrionales bacterium]